MSTGYTGHGKSGGVQMHSKGPMYPYTILVVGDPNTKLMYSAFDLRSSSEGPRRHTYKEAEIDVYSARVRNMMH